MIDPRLVDLLFFAAIIAVVGLIFSALRKSWVPYRALACAYLVFTSVVVYRWD